MAEQGMMEQQASQLDAAYQAENAAAQSGAQGNQGNQDAVVNRTQQQQEPAFNPAEFKAFMDEFKQFRNQTSSQLGNFSKKQSELDKFLATQSARPTPQSWDKLDEATRKATEELVSHIVESRYGDKFKTWDSTHESWQEMQANNRVEGLAHQILGKDYEKYDEALGNIYIQVRTQADQGDKQAQEFLKDIRTTGSGVYRLVDMAKSQISQSLQNQSEQAKADQEAKARRAASGVGGSRATQTGTGADGLPTDKAERRKAIAAKIDEFNKAQN